MEVKEPSAECKTRGARDRWACGAAKMFPRWARMWLGMPDSGLEKKELPEKPAKRRYTKASIIATSAIAVGVLLVVAWSGMITTYSVLYTSYGGLFGLLGRGSNDVQRYFSFTVCNGFANQRIGILFGILMAHQLDRTVVLPMMPRNGTQFPDLKKGAASVEGSSNLAVSAFMAEFYDVAYLQEALQGLGIKSVKEWQLPKAKGMSPVVISCRWSQEEACLRRMHSMSALHLHMHCPFPEISVSSSYVRGNPQLVESILKALQPSQKLQSIIDLVVPAINPQMKGKKPGFNFLHARIEHDWVSHCHWWTNINDGAKRDNCWTNVKNIGPILTQKGFETEFPLFVATTWPQVSKDLKIQLNETLYKAGYTVVTLPQILQQFLSDVSLCREESALVEYYIGLKARSTIGNSVSTFTALMIIERNMMKNFASYYNGGVVPLEDRAPVLKLPWVFVYNPESEIENYVIRAAVMSAIDMGQLLPFCIFLGKNTVSSDRFMFDWFEAMNVTIIKRKPSWMGQIMKTDKDDASGGKAAVDRIMQLDIPILKGRKGTVLQAYNYVLFTDVRVFFRKPLVLSNFRKPLPASVGMSPDAVGKFPSKARVALWNTLNMGGHNYERLIGHTLTQSLDLHVPGNTVLDIGGVSTTFQQSTAKSVLAEELNGEATFFDESSSIVFFDGPSPQDYLSYLINGSCPYGGACRKGICNGFCTYAAEWAKHEFSGIGLKLEEMCHEWSRWKNSPNRWKSCGIGI